MSALPRNKDLSLNKSFITKVIRRRKRIYPEKKAGKGGLFPKPDLEYKGV
jgi:hypothetical protein